MAPEKIETAYFSADILDFFRLLDKHAVRYVVVGGEAAIHYGHARLTGDIDFFYENQAANIQRLFQALRDFWDGDIPGIGKPEELQEEGTIIQFGKPPNRIDRLNQIDGVQFSEAWESHTVVPIETGSNEIPVRFIGLQNLIKNKAASGRPKDLEDLEFLRKLS